MSRLRLPTECRRSATPTEEGKKIVGIDDLKAISSSDVTTKKIYFSQYLAACTVPSSATKTPHRLSYSELAIVSGAWRRGRRRTPPLRRLGEAKKTGEPVDLFEIKQQIRNQRSCRRLALHLLSRGACRALSDITPSMPDLSWSRSLPAPSRGDTCSNLPPLPTRRFLASSAERSACTRA